MGQGTQIIQEQEDLIINSLEAESLETNSLEAESLEINSLEAESLEISGQIVIKTAVVEAVHKALEPELDPPKGIAAF